MKISFFLLGAKTVVGDSMARGTEWVRCRLAALCCLLHAQHSEAQVKMEIERPRDQSGTAPIWEQSLYKQ